jgi:WD40 repeat protein
MTKTTSKWPRIILIAGSLIGLVCCAVIGIFWFLNRAASNLISEKHSAVRSLAWSPDGSQLAVGSADHTITIWEVKSAKLLMSLTKHNAAVRELAWSPDGTLLASGGNNGAVYLWDAFTGELIEQIVKENEEDALGFLDWSPDGYFLAYTGGQGSINGWDIKRRLKTFFAQSKNGVTGISWSPDDIHLATSSVDGTATIWNRQTGKLVWIINAHEGWVNDVDWASDGTLLASGGDDGKLKIWDPKTGTLIEEYIGSDRVFSVAWSPTVVSQIAWGSSFGEVTITESNESDRHLSAGSGQVWVVAWSRDGQQLAAGTDTNTIFIWDTATGQQIQLLTLPMP